MNPITHFLISWNIAGLSATEKRDRILITIGGLLPDLDGLGAIVEVATRHQLDFYSKYHHQLTHNITTGIIAMIGAILLAKKKLATGLLFLLAFHVHLLCDLIGARGPDGYQWPIAYFFPFSSDIQLTWSHQWGLVSWQNYAITVAMVVIVFIISLRKEHSPFEVFSAKLDRRFVEYLKRKAAQ